MTYAFDFIEEEEVITSVYAGLMGDEDEEEEEEDADAEEEDLE